MKRIAILATDGFQDSELSEPYERLKDAGFKVLVIGAAAGRRITGKNGDFSIDVDLGVESVNLNDFDALVIPGGESPERLRRNEAAVKLARAFLAGGKPVAAICHAPEVLNSAGSLRDRTLTGHVSLKNEIEDAGGKFVDEAIVIDRNLITSRKPADLPQFIDAIISFLEEDEEQLPA